MGRKSDITKEHILRVATDLFLENGYENTFTKEVALASDTSEALLFKYFSSKENLYIEVFRKVISSLSDEAKAYFNPAQPLQWLYTFARDLVMPDEQTPRIAAMFGQVMRIQVKHCVMSSMKIGDFHPILTNIIANGQAMGQITVCDEAERLAYVYYRFIVGLIIDDFLFPRSQPFVCLETVGKLFSAHRHEA